MLAWMVQDMTTYNLTLVITAEKEKVVTPPLLPPVAVMRSEDLLAILYRLQYGLSDTHMLADMDSQSLSELAAKVTHDVESDQYPWQLISKEK